VIHDNTVTWLATWTENVNGATKYVFLAPGSSLKGQSDLKKFETARRLKSFVATIRSVNKTELRGKEMFVRQRATALWLIDHLALRAGNEKGDDEADTVGCCSLRLEHIKLVEPSTVIFDFLGKDSIRYYNEVQVDPIIFKNLSIFMRAPKLATDPVFDRLNTGGLNKYLNGLMEGLTAKVFRTYNASHTFQSELQKTDPEASIAEKILSYNRANRQVAILCNHQRAVPKTHGQSMERLRDKIMTLKYQRWLIRQEIKEAGGSGECPDALEPESDFDDAVVEEKREEAERAQLERYRKKHPDADSVPPSPKKTTPAATLLKRFHAATARIHAAKSLLIDRDENKTTSLGTSKTNYIDRGLRRRGVPGMVCRWRGCLQRR
jgi:DNA topoisomerase-1